MRFLTQPTVDTKSGFSLLEMLIYMTLLLVVSVAAVSLILSLSKTVQSYHLEQSVMRNSTNVLEQLLVDIRAAHSVDTTNSVFNETDGVLVLDTETETITYRIQTGGVARAVGGTTTLLQSDKVETTQLEFTHIDNGRSAYVQVDMMTIATSSEATSSRQYTAGAVTRAMYE